MNNTEREGLADMLSAKKPFAIGAVGFNLYFARILPIIPGTLRARSMAV